MLAVLALAVAATPAPAAPLQPQVWTAETVRAVAQDVVTVLVAVIAFGGSIVVSRNSAKAARSLEADKREHVDEGLRRKLGSLMSRADRVLQMNLKVGAVEPDSWAHVGRELHDYVMTPEVASAVKDEQTISAAYDVLDAVEFAYDRAADLYARMQHEYDELVEQLGGALPEPPPMWTPHYIARMTGIFVPPARALSK